MKFVYLLAVSLSLANSFEWESSLSVDLDDQDHRGSLSASAEFEDDVGNDKNDGNQILREITKYGEAILKQMKGQQKMLEGIRTELKTLSHERRQIKSRMHRYHTKVMTSGKKTVSLEQGPCKKGWFYNNDTSNCYIYRRNQTNWREAVKGCVDQGARLVTIESEKEINFVSDVLNSNGARNCWTAGKSVNSEWVWDMGSGKKDESLGYVRWLPSEPNNYNNDSEFHVELTWYSRGQMGYNDLNERQKRGYVCEMDMN